MILKFDHHKYCPARQARATTCSLPTREGMHKFITIAGSDRKSLSIPGGDFLDISSMASAPSWKATADAAIVSRSRSSLMNFQRPLPLQRRASSKTSCFALDCSLDSARYWNASFAVRLLLLLLLLLPDILIFLIEFWGFWIRNDTRYPFYVDAWSHLLQFWLRRVEEKKVLSFWGTNVIQTTLFTAISLAIFCFLKYFFLCCLATIC